MAGLNSGIGSGISIVSQNIVSSAINIGKQANPRVPRLPLSPRYSTENARGNTATKSSAYRMQLSSSMSSS